jgi:hypothetical protein
VTSERKRAKQTGRGRTPPFLLLRHDITSSPEWAALSPKAVKLLIEIASQFRGYNNGDLSAPWSKMKLRGFRSPQTLHNAKQELIAAGFIVVTKQGGMHGCTLFAVTWLSIDECKGKLDCAPEKVASNAWRKTRAQYELRTTSQRTDTKSVRVAA